MGYTTLDHLTDLSPNHSGKRTMTIDTITPHCVVGQATAKRIGEIFEPTSRQASCNYGIGYDGKIILVVDEDNRSWCTSSAANDQRAITYEIASDNYHPYAFTDLAYEASIALTVEIMKRLGKKRLVWNPDKNAQIAYKPAADEMKVTVHRWFANKACPGDWFYNRLDEWTEEINRRLAAGEEPEADPADDVNKPSAWAAADWKWAIENGITDGTRPRDYATREQVMVLIHRVWGKQT